jgi:hypothetical protein
MGIVAMDVKDKQEAVIQFVGFRGAHLPNMYGNEGVLSFFHISLDPEKTRHGNDIFPLDCSHIEKRGETSPTQAICTHARHAQSARSQSLPQCRGG